MLPYLSLTSISIGPLTLHVWGILVALGFFVGALMAGRMAKRRGLSPSVVYDLVPWLALAGMLGGRLGHVFFYEPAYFLEHPLEILAIWHGGLSVYGGIVACIAVSFVYFRKKNIDMFAYSDVLVFGLPFGKVFGRIGCFLIHDHPGTLTHFLLGVKYPNGEVRHDLGLYLALNAFALALAFLWLARKERPVGTYLVVFALWYGTARFFLDFLRVVDVRYGGFTPGQYFSLLLILTGVSFQLWITHRAKRAKDR